MQQYPQTVSQAPADARGAFLARTYLHLLGAIVAFVGLEAALFASGAAEKVAELTLGSGRLGFGVLLLAFIGVGWLGERFAHSRTSVGMQYAGLGIYVVAEAFIFIPLLYVAAHYAGPSVIPSAAVVTLVLFGGLTATVLITRQDFSFMRPFLMFAGFGAMALIGASLLFGFNLGVFFSFAMVALAGGYILFTTSNMLHRYQTDQHVGAALALFASVAMMFYYVLRIFMSRR